VREDGVEILLRADNPKIFDNTVPELAKLYRNATGFQYPGNRPQSRPGSDVDRGHYNEKSSTTVFVPRWRFVDQIHYLTADMVGIEVEPCAGVSRDNRLGRFVGASISVSIDKAPRALFTTRGRRRQVARRARLM
jgi:hypothetical protein